MQYDSSQHPSTPSVASLRLHFLTKVAVKDNRNDGALAKKVKSLPIDATYVKPRTMSTVLEDANAIPNIFHASSGQSSLACSNCRRQKTRCNRLLPSCDGCLRANRTCEYPLTSRRPGPRTGTTRRRPRSTSPSDVGQTSAKRHRSAQQDRSEDHATEVAEEREASLPSDAGSDIAEVAYPSHEEDQFRRALGSDGTHAQTNHAFDEACSRLELSPEEGREAIRIYFDNMTAFSLFHAPTFYEKLTAIRNVDHLTALLASMLAFAAFFVDGDCVIARRLERVMDPVDRAARLNRDCIDADPDATPPLHLLQSLLIITLLQVFRGVRGLAWRQVGLCIRIALELRLHRLDARSERASDRPGQKPNEYNQQEIAHLEEKRRAWWALWEMDVFTSTLRAFLPDRIPTIYADYLPGRTSAHDD